VLVLASLAAACRTASSPAERVIPAAEPTSLDTAAPPSPREPEEQSQPEGMRPATASEIESLRRAIGLTDPVTIVQEEQTFVLRTHGLGDVFFVPVIHPPTEHQLSERPSDTVEVTLSVYLVRLDHEIRDLEIRDEWAHAITDVAFRDVNGDGLSDILFVVYSHLVVGTGADDRGEYGHLFARRGQGWVELRSTVSDFTSDDSEPQVGIEDVIEAALLEYGPLEEDDETNP
jgi:hypothetical protein